MSTNPDSATDYFKKIIEPSPVMDSGIKMPVKPRIDPENEKVFSHDDLYKAGAFHWLGYSMQKSPFDMFAFHNLIYDIRPDIFLETGTFHGASALFYATVMDALNHGLVITIDIMAGFMRPKHPRIWQMVRDSADPETAAIVKSYTEQVPKVMVTLDSNHDGAHVYKELEAYGPMVTIGSFLVVEDTNINGHPIRPGWAPNGGPWEAVHDWLPKHPEFKIDYNYQPALYTNNPDGWLRRIE